MHKTLSTLLARLDTPTIASTDIIPWGCPVPSFGDLSSSRIATLGLNPSNREFVDESGEELEGPFRRFHTLKSLGLRCWSDATPYHLRLILETCRDYFSRNPYDRWFKKLDIIISGTMRSYYDSIAKACHLDLIPYATRCKWTELDSRQRSRLLDLAGDTLALLLRESPIQIVILNGNSVVQHFETVANIRLEVAEMPNWALPRRNNEPVTGFAYSGVVRTLSGIRLDREIRILGFNHNIQSSFGVTNTVIQAIRLWIAKAAANMNW